MSVALHCRIWLAAIPLAVVVLAQDELSIRVEVDLVSVLCSVRDEHGALVNHLKQDDFILLEEGKPQTIRHFAREKDLPLTVGLLVDTSNSQARFDWWKASAALPHSFSPRSFVPGTLLF